MEKIKVYGTKWCRDTQSSHERCWMSAESAMIGFDINQDPDAEAFVKETNQGLSKRPHNSIPG